MGPWWTPVAPKRLGRSDALRPRPRSKYVVRYREDGRRRTACFDTPEEAEAFENARAGARRPLKPRARKSQRSAARVAELEVQLAVQHDADALGDGVFVYSTKRGTRYGFKFRQSDGTSSTRRGFTSRRAVRAAKGGLEGSIRRGEIRVGRESFTEFWDKLLADRKPYLVKGSYEGMAIAGRLRLKPFFGQKKMSQIDEELVREFMNEMADLVATGDLKPKTVDNTRTYLAIALGDAKRKGMLHVSPCDYVKPVPVTFARRSHSHP
jgi:hypothetical protein